MQSVGFAMPYQLTNLATPLDSYSFALLLHRLSKILHQKIKTEAVTAQYDWLLSSK